MNCNGKSIWPFVCMFLALALSHSRKGFIFETLIRIQSSEKGSYLFQNFRISGCSGFLKLSKKDREYLRVITSRLVSTRYVFVTYLSGYRLSFR